LRGAFGGGKTNVVDGDRAKRGHVDAERVQVFEGLAAQELSTDFVAWGALAFNQRNAPAFAGELDGSSTACDSAAENENFILQKMPALGSPLRMNFPSRIR
jgi:hypothetical protein